MSRMKELCYERGHDPLSQKWKIISKKSMNGHAMLDHFYLPESDILYEKGESIHSTMADRRISLSSEEMIMSQLRHPFSTHDVAHGVPNLT